MFIKRKVNTSISTKNNRKKDEISRSNSDEYYSNSSNDSTENETEFFNFKIASNNIFKQSSETKQNQQSYSFLSNEEKFFNALK